jgi:hypothetical protein
MYAGSHEWQRPQPAGPSALAPQPGPAGGAELYRRLMRGTPDAGTRAEAAVLLRRELDNVHLLEGDLPDDADALQGWMESSAQAVHAQYAAYMAGRKGGAPRRLFTNRAHALYVLRNVAPTKLVDGAWLYGLVRHAANPRLSDLVRTYVEELGEGDAGKNHVVLYRELLNRYNLDPLDDLEDGCYTQGLIQLALGWNAEDFLPEIIGFNLGYEQLPLHLLITAHELNELGLDPYYFTLHVTVDNGDTGHARRACQAVLDLLPQLADGGEFWRRVRAGCQLAGAGTGTMDIVDGFRIDDEVARILARKSVTGHGAHSDYCRVAGKTVNEWLAQPDAMPAFLAALQAAGWIRRGQPVEESRFWGLLQGPRAEMFGVFSSYELQVIHDWIRDAASSDGAAYSEGPAPAGRTRRASFRAMQRAQLPAASGAAAPPGDLLDPDLDAFKSRFGQLQGQARDDLLFTLMSPSLHWTPAGLAATQAFWAAR